MKFFGLQMLFASISLFASVAEALIEGQGLAGPSHHTLGHVEHGRGWNSGSDTHAYEILERREARAYLRSPRDALFESPYKRQGTCEEDQENCGNGCMPKGSSCCSGISYCNPGSECTTAGRCRSTSAISTTGTSAQATSTDGVPTDATKTFVTTIISTGTLQASIRTDIQSSSIIEVIRTVTAAPVDESNGNSNNGGVSPGIIAGATVGGVVVGALAMGALWFLFRRRRGRRDQRPGEDRQNKQLEATPSPFLSSEASQTGSKPGTELDSTDLLEMECHRSTVKGRIRLAELEQPVQLSELDATQQPKR